MTEAEIMKALECISGKIFYCSDCAYRCGSVVVCHKKSAKDAIDLINRKNAEIESLEREIPKYAVRVKVKNGLIYSKTLEDYDWLIGDISAEAINEFANLAEKRICEKVNAPTPTESYIVEKCIEVVWQIAKEMGVEL